MTLTRAARIAEDDLYNVIINSCSAGTTGQLDGYADRTKVQALMESALINETAVTETASLALDAAYPATSASLSGLLLNNAGVGNCKVRPHLCISPLELHSR